MFLVGLGRCAIAESVCRRLDLHERRVVYMYSTYNVPSGLC